MLKRFWLFIQGIEYSVEHIVAPMGTMIAELERHAASKIAKALKFKQTAAKAEAKSATADAAAVEATAIAKNFKALIVTK